MYLVPPYSPTKIYAAHMSCSTCCAVSAVRAGPEQQTRRPPLLLSIDRQTDGRPPFCDADLILSGMREKVRDATLHRGV